ncbi:hypothetical protein [Massilia sp. 9096]|uniref:hypothetical protein n=1 Tax=Massilia sp. 9096 TaxID=1500894 RepID=UPI00056223D3|nr:hypothetical protein [Massilia sp. 9096]
MKALLVLILCASLAGNFYQYQKAKDGRRPESSTIGAPIVMRTRGGLLEVSAISATEQFEATDAHSFLRIHLGSTVGQIKVPAVYRYHIELAPEWKIRFRNKTFVVIAPAVQPTLPVAIDTKGIRQQSTGIWSVVTGSAVLDKILHSISPGLNAKAATPAYIRLQREAARSTVKEFVAKWLITQAQWKAYSAYPIQVYFADEPIQVLRTEDSPVD